MRIAIVGTGGVGGYYGARLAASGCEVFFIARGAHFQALRETGLQLESPLGPANLVDIEVYENPADAPKADVALSCVKLYDAEKAAQICKTVLHPDGIAVALQNGIDGPEFLSNVLGADRTFTGSVIISAHVEKPGLIKHVGKVQTISIEKREGLAQQLFEKCVKAKLTADQVEDPQLLLWRKFVRLVPLSGIAILCRSPMGVIRENPYLCEVLRQLVIETAGIARAKGVTINDSIAEDVMGRIDKAPYEFKPSLLLDFERGNRLEAPWLAGRVVQIGKELGLATPYNGCVWAALQPFI